MIGDADLRRFVSKRAGKRCEYCHLPQSAVDLTFHIEHIVAKQHGGKDGRPNRCLACDRCNLTKGPNLTSIDPVTMEIVPLFHPRRDTWSDHFRMAGTEIAGKTPCGRATVGLLQMNTPRRTELRARLIAAGEY